MLDYRPETREERSQWRKWIAWKKRILEPAQADLRGFNWSSNTEGWDAGHKWWTPREELARASEFLATIRQMPATCLLRHVASKREVNFLAIADCPDLRNPYRVNRYLCKVATRANRMLKPYGVRVSNSALASAITPKNRRERNGTFASSIRKAAKAAAAQTLAEVLNRQFGYQENGEEIFYAARGLALALQLPKPVQQWIADRCHGAFSLRKSVEFAKWKLAQESVRGKECWVEACRGKMGISIRLCYPADGSKSFWEATTSRGTIFIDVVDVATDERAAIHDALRQWRIRDLESGRKHRAWMQMVNLPGYGYIDPMRSETAPPRLGKRSWPTGLVIEMTKSWPFAGPMDLQINDPIIFSSTYDDAVALSGDAILTQHGMRANHFWVTSGVAVNLFDGQLATWERRPQKIRSTPAVESEFNAKLIYG